MVVLRRTRERSRDQLASSPKPEDLGTGRGHKVFLGVGGRGALVAAQRKHDSEKDGAAARLRES